MDDFELGPYGFNITYMTEDDALKLADAIPVISAACCIVGVTPSIAVFGDNPSNFSLIGGNSIGGHDLPYAQVEMVVKAICAAITTGKIEPAHTSRPSIMEFGITFYDIWDTLIEVDELKRWLLSRNCKPPFFFGADASNTPDYLEPKHPSFSPEIAAAIKAWEAIQDQELRKGKTVKAAVTEWLNTHYRELGLMHNGNRSNSAIERIATLVNWETSGGAPKTPG
jgi:hypothetical protein